MQYSGISTEPSELDEYHLGILFVHGIGAQKRGQTLAEFGSPIYQWLVDRVRGLNQRWREIVEDNPQREVLSRWRNQLEIWARDGFPHRGVQYNAVESDLIECVDPGTITALASRVGGETLVAQVTLTDSLVTDPGDPGAPAHAELRFQRLTANGSLEVERWLLAESWWAETFAAPTFRDLVLWGFRIIPWTIGNHFAAKWNSILRRHTGQAAPKGSLRLFANRTIALARIAVALLGLLAAPAVSVLMLFLFSFILLVGLLPIPQVREMLLKLQLTLSSTLGDSYVLLSRPIEAASIVGQVRRDLKWLSDRCKAVAIVGHSQGGAVAHLALQEDIPSRLKLLFTFGSGLKKLEQLRYLLSSGQSYLRSSILSVVAYPFLLFAIVWFVYTFFGSSQAKAPLVGSLVMLGYLAISGVLLWAGLRDYIRGFDLTDLQRWTERLRSRLHWIDCFATADPVSNGYLFDSSAIQNLSREVCNKSSFLGDHTSYWTNRDQFVTLLLQRLFYSEIRQYAGLPPVPDLTIDQVQLQHIGNWRRWRVGVSTTFAWIAVVAVLAAIFKERVAWAHLVEVLTMQVNGWMGRLFGGEAGPAVTAGLHWPAVGYLVLALVPFGINRWYWYSWNNIEMRKLIEGGAPSSGFLLYPLLLFQLVFTLKILEEAAGTAGSQYLTSFWIIFLSSLVVLAIFTSTSVAVEFDLKNTSRIGDAQQVISGMDKLLKRVERFVDPLLPVVSFGIVSALAFGWFRINFSFSILGVQPSDKWDWAVGLAVGAALWIVQRARARSHGDREKSGSIGNRVP